jgi:hypothetical protein
MPTKRTLLSALSIVGGTIALRKDANPQTDAKSSLSKDRKDVGTFEDLVTTESLPGQSKSIHYPEILDQTAVATLDALLREKTANLADGTVRYVLGWERAYDGGGGLFNWQAGCVDDADEVLIYHDGSAGPGRWHRLYSHEINARWGGYLPGRDPATNTQAIQKVIRAALIHGLSIVIPPGIYDNTPWPRLAPDLKRQILTIKGTGNPGRAGFSNSIPTQQVTILRFPGLSQGEIAIPLGYESSGSNDLWYGIELKDLLISGPGAKPDDTIGLELRRCPSSRIDNVKIENFHTGLSTWDCWNNTIGSLEVARCHIGAWFGSQFNAAIIGKFNALLCQYGLVVTSGDAVSIQQFTCEKSAYGAVIGSSQKELAPSAWRFGQPYLEDLSKVAFAFGFVPDGKAGIKLCKKPIGSMTVDAGRYVDASNIMLAKISQEIEGQITFFGDFDGQSPDQFDVHRVARPFLKFPDHSFFTGSTLQAQSKGRKGPFLEDVWISKTNLTARSDQPLLQFHCFDSTIAASFRGDLLLQSEDSLCVCEIGFKIILRRGAGVEASYLLNLISGPTRIIGNMSATLSLRRTSCRADGTEIISLMLLQDNPKQAAAAAELDGRLKCHSNELNTKSRVLIREG